MGVPNDCNPLTQIFQERISGVFSHTSATVWMADKDHYAQGTFSIYNAAGSNIPAIGTVNGQTVFTVPTGYTIARHVQTPTSFHISAESGVNGSYCITLYKKILP